MRNIWLLFFIISTSVFAQNSANTDFEQLGTMLPTPNTTRTASGAPGKSYWQQKADYNINAELDDENQLLKGSEKITYFNNSPDALDYLWVQLDQNNFNEKSDARSSRTTSLNADKGVSSATLKSLSDHTERAYGYDILSVKDAQGTNLPFVINGTMMRIDLPTKLPANSKVSFSIDWKFNIVDVKTEHARSGFEYFEKDKNYIYEMAQWFPRMCVYDDVVGWQNKQLLGQGEFTLSFGDYHVSIKVPSDMVVGATGELINQKQVLTAEQLNRLKKAENSAKPICIVNGDEALENEKSRAKTYKTWTYEAKNVRDFVFAASRKFIWDAMKVDVEGKKVWAMSLYPKEGNPLWGQYSTRLVAHTLVNYSKRTVAYPYPVAYSVHGPVGGMEYPMMSFNGARPQPDGTYSEGVKNFLILVIIHEVGHNFFPMIINSDERQWSWMDEGLNSFVEGLTCLEWDRNFPAKGIEPSSIVAYMKTEPTKQNAIMTSSDNILPGTFGPNAYSKPATGLNILRETVMGRELFDYAFKEYARRWAFKQPTPADFFRTMEDASGVDLDWFWKGWFYGVEAMNQSLADVEWMAVDNQNPEEKARIAKELLAQQKLMNVSNQRNLKDIPKSVVEADSSMRDFYNSYDPNRVSEKDTEKYKMLVNNFSDAEKKIMTDSSNYYTLNIKNKGGLLMPVIVQAKFEDGTFQDYRFPVEIWRFNNKEIKKTIITKKKVAKFKLDPYNELPDIDTSDNSFPKEPEQPSRFQMIKQAKTSPALNPMQEAQKSGGGAGLGGSGKN